MRRLASLGLALTLGCAGAAPAPAPTVPRAAPALAWSALDAHVFDRARREGRLVLLYGAAEWCHWCHVMEDETYADPAVRAVLDAHFVIVRVDVDARPDIQERYVDWGWPATILLDAGGRELGKYRGYMPAARMRGLLEAAVASPRARHRAGADTAPGSASAPLEALPWVFARTLRDMDAWYDDDLAGWGRRQKLALGANAEVEARRAAAGDEVARRRMQDSLHAQRALLDPVHGGLYQYSVGKTWGAPHYEKLMTYQAPNLEAYAAAYALTGDAAFAQDAQAILRYLDETLSSPDGAFYPNQDADVGTHDPSAARVAGAEYYARDAAGRRALGAPWVDPHVYGYENGLAIAALVRLHEATGDPAPLARAVRAARALLASHLTEAGAVRHEPADRGIFFLADNAAVCRAFALLARHAPAFRAPATRIAAFMSRTMFDANTGAYFASTEDPDAVGVFSARRHAFDHNVLAARALAALAEVTQDPAQRRRARRVLAAIATPGALDAQGRMLGGFLLALDEAKVPGLSPRTTPRARSRSGRGSESAGRPGS